MIGQRHMWIKCQKVLPNSQGYPIFTGYCNCRIQQFDGTQSGDITKSVLRLRDKILRTWQHWTYSIIYAQGKICFCNFETKQKIWNDSKLTFVYPVLRNLLITVLKWDRSNYGIHANFFCSSIFHSAEYLFSSLFSSIFNNVVWSFVLF